LSKNRSDTWAAFLVTYTEGSQVNVTVPDPLKDRDYLRNFMKLDSVGTLNEAERKELNDSMREGFRVKFEELRKCLPHPEAYFRLGQLFLYDLRRIVTIGQIEQIAAALYRMRLPGRNEDIVGYVPIIQHCLGEYLKLAPSGAYSDEARKLLSKMA